MFKIRNRLSPQMPLPTPQAQAYEECVLGWSSRDYPQLRAAKDIAYGTHPAQRYDVYGAEHMADAPIVVFLHGGGWTNGYKEYAAFMAPSVVAAGCVLVTPGYRLAPEHPLPAAFDDGIALLRSLAATRPAWAGNARRVILAGHSAGGHLAALLALRPDALHAAGVDPRIVAGCMPVSGIFDLHHPQPAPGSLEARVYEMVLGPDTDDARMSPLCWVRGNTVPMALTYGEHDSDRVVLSNRRMASLLALQPAAVSCEVERAADHFATHTMLERATHPWYARLAALAHDSASPCAPRIHS
ncbi:alpha/beta hydrolase [Paraburkholderia susongensis]|uniref:Acetyl esterase/lipase n=1 Tax=Paraburkholderia susongensis TaxID=1515439 RepID=A0A1X7LXX5_9BURK|nr:alpha/beta hydrolase [Paraburkholderia susongensis]SMG58287.1 Acetyl esterase/lipase [Paraburkholderia susongensis]